MSELAQVDVRRNGANVLAAVTGEIDASNADDVRIQLEAAATAPDLTLDLSALDYLDSAGVRMLFAVADYAEIRHTTFTVVTRGESPVRRVLDITGVADVARLVFTDAHGVPTEGRGGGSSSG